MRWREERKIDKFFFRQLPANISTWALVISGLASGNLGVALLFGGVWYVLTWIWVGAIWGLFLALGVPLVDTELWDRMKSCGCLLPGYLIGIQPLQWFALLALTVRLVLVGQGFLLTAGVLGLYYVALVILTVFFGWLP